MDKKTKRVLIAIAIALALFGIGFLIDNLIPYDYFGIWSLSPIVLYIAALSILWTERDIYIHG